MQKLKWWCSEPSYIYDHFQTPENQFFQWDSHRFILREDSELCVHFSLTDYALSTRMIFMKWGISNPKYLLPLNKFLLRAWLWLLTCDKISSTNTTQVRINYLNRKQISTHFKKGPLPWSCAVLRPFRIYCHDS